MDEQYQIIFLKKQNGFSPVREYLCKLPEKDKAKIINCIKNISIYPEFRKEPFSRHLKDKLRELKIDFGNNKHRIIYFFNIGEIIILLHAFGKKTAKTPNKEIKKAENYMWEFLDNLT